jgi:hypothetical protein
MIDPELDAVPTDVRKRALRAALIAFDRVLEPYPLDPLARLDLLEWCLEDEYEQVAATFPPEPLN